jgi:hypothetical protein
VGLFELTDYQRHLVVRDTEVVVRLNTPVSVTYGVQPEVVCGPGLVQVRLEARSLKQWPAPDSAAARRARNEETAVCKKEIIFLFGPV